MKKLQLTIILILFTVFAYAQVTTSNIKGLIMDDANVHLFGANIVAVHGPTGTKYGAISNVDGRYNLLNLRIGGPYKVTVSYVGFEDKVFENVFLTLGKTTNIDAVMSTSEESLDEVVITGSSSGTFGSDRTGAETSVGKRELTTLPTISRSAADFTRLEPSASGNSFGGRNDQFNNFTLDGAVFNNPFGLDAATPGGQTDSQPISLDAIDQIQVSLAPYDVTLSGFTGAAVNAVTKSGTNEFHGTVYGFTRNEDMTGGKILGQDVFQSDLKQNQYGVSLGGPIIKNKLFFFANFEKDERSDLGTNGFAPNRGTGAINETRVLESDLITVQNGLASIGYDTGRYEGFNYDSNSTKGIFKLDWNISDNHRLAVIYNFLNASKEKPAHPSALGFRGPSFATLQFENSGYEINNNINSVQLELNSTLSSSITNKLQVGYTHFDDFRNPLSSPMPAFRILDGAGTNYIVAGHEPFSINNKLDQKVLQFSNNLNYVKGDHTFTAGVSYEKFEFDNSFNLGAYGYGFGPGQYPEYPDGGYVGAFYGDFADIEAFNTAISSGMLADAMANAQNVYDTNTNNDSWALAETNVGQFAFYLQDEWNVTDNFKLTYGVRFDKPLFFDSSTKAQEVIDRACCYSPDIEYINPNTGEGVFLDNTKMPSNKFLISPRIGFNYDVEGDSSFQFRGGTGLFTGRLPFVWLGNQIANPEVFFYQMVDPDFKFPQVWRTNIGADYRFDNGIVATGDISYTKDINGAHVQNWGLRNPSGTLDAPGDTRPIYTDSDKINDAFVFTNSDKGRIWNFTAKAQKTFDNGLYTSLAYNYLNSKDVNSIEAEITGDAFAFNPVVGNANDDVLSYSKYGDTHRFIGVASKKFTYGDDKWSTTISTFFEYAQGGRFNYTYGGDLNGDGSALNDLLYVPTASELQNMQFSGAGQAEAYEAFIQQDDYLSERRGDYVERYGALAPWRGRWDLKLLQDYNFNVGGGKTNTIQLSLDVLNIGNLINSEWGVVQQPTSVQPVGVDVDASGVPTYTFTGVTETFSYDTSLLSRWQAQFGVRYIF
ncbi:carboxypeptidase regulatory-like domain-containing protein [uncultured Olleya sp.]|uniref:TonB-dependent receptor n=1 Tax=uncultured Olleya sp. TaxID=757243 RepID=UPI0025957324|nr:carboxypeptidase regulatory-like domain-containing protein [uncultured Olleya sp.]